MIARPVERFPEEEAVALFRAPPERYLDVGAGQVAYRCVGTGPDVLFVHGWPVSSATFRCLLPHLAPHVTCHLIDLVGAGQSRFDRATPIDLDRNIEGVRRVVDLLGLDALAVVGHDSGGLVARHALASDPRLRAMVLIGTEQPRGLSASLRLLLLLARLPGFGHLLGWAVMQRIVRSSRLLLGGCFTDRSRIEGDFEALLLAPLRDDPDRRWAAAQLIRSFHRRYVDALAGLHGRIDVPVQLVWGEHDPFFPVAWAQEMVPTFADARLHVVAGARLFVHEEHPAQVAGAILPTLLGTR